MIDAALRAGATYAIEHSTHAAGRSSPSVVDCIDVHTLTPDETAGELACDEIGRVGLRMSKWWTSTLRPQSRHGLVHLAEYLAKRHAGHITSLA